MRLYSGAPFWLIKNGLEDLQTQESDRFPDGREFDVVVAGAGITGALVADALSAEQLSVAVLDRRAPASGSTAATTSLVSYELDAELSALGERIGATDAARAYQLSAEAVGALGSIASGFPQASGYGRRPSLYLASRARDAARLEREAALRQRHGLDAEFWTRKQVEERYGFPCFGALRTACAAVVDPVRLTRSLLGRAQTRGAVVLPYTRLRHVAEEKEALRITTDRGALLARRVVYAMGYETPEPLRPDLTALHSTYALATEPIHDLGALRDGCLVWESARPYFYMRLTDDGRIVAGGADVPFADADRRDRLLPDRTRRLERKLRTLVPDLDTTTAFSWAGTFAETPDGLPFIGPGGDCARALFALGYGGNGITFGVVAANIVRDLCLGRPNADARLFRLDR